MMWTLGFILLMTYTSCSSSQPVLVQPPSVVTSPAQNVKIPCTLSSGGNFDIYRVLWIQQLLGKAPRLAYHFRIGSTQGTGPGVPNRFSVSADAGTRLWNLVITGVQVDDEADYYCATYFDGTFGFIFGGGTQLNVLTGETKGPTLSIFPPSQEEVEKDKSTVVCLYQDFYPASVDVTWTVGGQTITNGVEKSRATKQSENNLFMASSYLSLPTMDWSTNKEVTCQVTHQGKSFAKSVKKSECV